MPRPPRIDHAGAWHHVWHRGARRAPIFREDRHCDLFLDVIDRVVQRLGLEVHAYSLMPNHYHLLVCSRLGNLSRCMQVINGIYTQEVNQLHSWDGPVFRGRFKNQLIQDEAYLKELVAYLHLNPVRAHLVSRPEEECWTSHQAYLGLTTRPRWLTCDVLLEIFGGVKNLQDFVDDRHTRRTRWPTEMDLKMGWLRIAPQRPEGLHHSPTEAPPKGDIDVESILVKVAEIAGVTTADLLRTERGPSANPPRRFAAIALARWTQATQREIGIRLGMSTNQVAKVLARSRGENPREPDQWNQPF
ncbi:MAG: transposase [Pseudomonadota bacterium]